MITDNYTLINECSEYITPYMNYHMIKQSILTAGIINIISGSIILYGHWKDAHEMHSVYRVLGFVLICSGLMLLILRWQVFYEYF